MHVTSLKRNGRDKNRKNQDPQRAGEGGEGGYGVDVAIRENQHAEKKRIRNENVPGTKQNPTQSNQSTQARSHAATTTQEDEPIDPVASSQARPGGEQGMRVGRVPIFSGHSSELKKTRHYNILRPWFSVADEYGGIL